MLTKIRKGLPKRIVAFVMAVLMILSLMPIDPSVMLAADEYTFTLKVSGEETTIKNADVEVYKAADDTQTLFAIGTTSDEGVISVSGLNAAEEGASVVFENGSTYRFVCYGYKATDITIDDNTNTDKTYSVELEAYSTITVSGTVLLPDGKNDYANINAVELLDASGNAIKDGETAVTADVNDETGEYSFSNVLAGYEYSLKFTSRNNAYDEVICPIDLTQATSDYIYTMESPLSENQELTLEFSSETAYDVYIAGTEKTYAPTVKNADGETPSGDYIITYALQDSTITNVTVKADENNNLVVSATEGASVGKIGVIATLTGADYVTVSAPVTVEIKEKNVNNGFDFVADGITKDNESPYEVEYNPNGTCDFNAVADLLDKDGNQMNQAVTYAVIADGDGEDADVIGIDANTGAITINKVGTATITAILPANGDYLETTIKIKLTVKPIEQTNDVKFNEPLDAEGGTLTYIYGKNTYDFAASSDEEGTIIKYSVTYEGTDAVNAGKASISDTKISFNAVGTYIVTATASKANYNDKTVSYTVIIEKADPGLVFETPEETSDKKYEENIINGKYLVDTNTPYDFVEKPLVSTKGAPINESGVTYIVSYSENYDKEKLGDLVTVENGEVIFQNIKDASIGTVDVTIQASWDGNENYKEDTTSYTFHVVDWNPTGDENFDWEDIYTLSGTSKNDWFTLVDEVNPLTVAIAENQEYAIFATAPTMATINNPTTSFEVTNLDDGTNNKISFYIMDTSATGNGYISAAYTADEIKVDEFAPSIMCIKQGEATFVDWLLYFFTGDEVKEEFVVDVMETTTTSELKKYYYISDSADTMSEAEYKAIEDWTEIAESTEIKIPVDSQSVIYAKVCDEAGHTAYAHTNGLITDNTAPQIEMTAPTLPEEQNGFYKEDFNVTVNVEEQQGLSGISKIVYWVGKQTGDGNVLESFEVTKETKANELMYSYSADIKIDSDAYNNEKGVTVFVQAEDNAGNKTDIKETTYKICKETPSISVSYDNNTVKNPKKNYYDAARTASITIDSRRDVFEESNVIVTVDGKARPWGDKESQSMTVPFETDGTHTLSVTYTNKCGDVAEPYTETFLIDTDTPSGTATLKVDNVEIKTWDRFLKELTFGIWKKPAEVVTVEAKANPDTTVVSMKYYVSHEKTLKSKESLSQLEKKEWQPYTNEKLDQFEDENIYAVYFKLEDEVGHVEYLSTDGFVLDGTESTVTIIESSEQANKYGYNNSDVELNVVVKENPELYSGIQKITYEVFNNGVSTQEGILWENSYDELPTYDELQGEFNTTAIDSEYSKHKIKVLAEKNNSDNVEVVVTAIDNAGNEAISEKYQLKINKTIPTVEIGYDNNNYTGYDGLTYFFNANRKATIRINDRATTFNSSVPSDVIVVRDKDGNSVTDDRVRFGTWKGEDVHETTVEFLQDGYYTIEVNYTNKADLGNAGKVSPVEGTEAPFAFVIDTTDPTNVSFEAAAKVWNEWFADLVAKVFLGKDTTVEMIASAKDETSSVKLFYYISEEDERINETEIKNVDWKAYDEENPPQITEDKRMSIYLKAVDMAGNDVYVNSQGIILDTKDAIIELKPEGDYVVPEDGKNIYTSDVNVGVTIDDSKISSGIKSVQYWILADGKCTSDEEGKGTPLYTFDNTTPLMSELQTEYSGNILVVAEKNNCSKVEVRVQVEDNSGNVSTESIMMDIDITDPTIVVEYNDSEEIQTKKTVGEKGYFDSERTATIYVTERADHFDAADFIKNVEITAEDLVKGNNPLTIPEVKLIDTQDGNEVNDTVHVFQIVYSESANYTFDVSYTDKAGRKCTSDEVVYNGETPKQFVVDKTKPTGSIAAGNFEPWEELLHNLTFGLWTPEAIEIEIKGNDTISPIDKIYYYKTSEFTPLSETYLKESVTDWTEGDSLTIVNDDIFVVYAKIVDYAGNEEYISTNGIIVDKTKPVVEAVSPEITLTPERPVNGIYDGNVKVDVGVKDPVVGNNSAYAGLRSITYEVYNMGTKTQEGTLYSFSEINPTQDKLVQSWNEQDIIVDASKNNSNDVVVKVTATDNAGNQSTAKANLKIDTAAPVIEVSYDNNNGDTTFADSVYYNVNRVATIKVTERNFNANAVDVDITNTDGTVPTISGWTTTVGTGNGDDTVHTATVVYSADGDYTFAISMKDKAGLANNGVNYGTSQAPTAFTIDKTAPVISVAYDNNDFANENYYKADRTATISILEHNFDASRVVATITATDNGQSVAAPTISGWSKSGDTYTATVNYSADALYTFDIVYSDKAQNQSADFAQQSFYVDKTMPQMSITEIVDQSANNKDQIGFVITATDTNFDVFEPILTAVVKTENGFVTQELNIASVSDITNGRVYTISNIDADGIYRITCTLVDKAGNAYTEVTLHRADGTPYVENRSAEDTLLTFSVNRNGSVFEVNEETQTVLDNYYVYDVTEDVVIVEVNANRLTTNRVTLNGKELVEGTDYVVTTEGGNGAWYKYIYTLNKELFVEEGEYTIVVSSIDEAENSAFSDVKSTKVAFVVDRTAPMVAVSGIEVEDGRTYVIDGTAKQITLIPTDDGGAVKSIAVNYIDKEGNSKPLYDEISGEKLEEALSAGNGQLTFELGLGEYETIQILCSDCSIREDGSTGVTEILIKDVIITNSEIVAIWNDYKYPIIVAIVALIAIPTGIVFFRKKKAK